ncbi:MAG: hypothetical protein DME26_20575 [Verrucomicrobia bacterium]|nr:MAG: hypothetical protein DME26_20575 [Verrucomicrobiota bacterium]
MSRSRSLRISLAVKSSSFWIDSARLPRFSALEENLEVDVAVIGAGVTGITAAYLTKNAGHTVALLDRGRCGGVDTSFTTAHLAYVTDERLHKLVKNFGREKAKAVWDAGMAALDQIVANIRHERIQCEFSWVPGYLHARLQGNRKEDRSTLQKDAGLAQALGFHAEYLETIPFFGLPGVKFEHQAKFHPLKYLAALVRAIPGNGSHVFENTEAREVQQKPLAVIAGRQKIRCRYVVLATHTPLMGKTNIVSATLFQSKLALYTTYAVGARLPAGYWPALLLSPSRSPARIRLRDFWRGRS